MSYKNKQTNILGKSEHFGKQKIKNFGKKKEKKKSKKKRIWS